MCLPSLLFYFISFVIIILIFRLHCRHLFFRVSERERERERKSEHVSKVGIRH
jgi:hypothetical protein